VEGSEVSRTVANDAKRVLFDARPAESGVTGIAQYARTLRTLMKGVPRHFCWSLGEDIKWTPSTPFEEELELPAILEREEIQVFHSPLFHLPALVPCRAVITLHDAIPLVRPDLSNHGFTRLFQEEAQEAAERADAIVCPSEHAKRDVVTSLKVHGGKVHVITETAAPQFRVLEKTGEPKHLLVVGSLEPRKNPLVVLNALAKLSPETRPRVVFVGPRAGIDILWEAHVRGLEESVSWAGTVPDDELVRLYNDAIALVFPSFYEGFGLPVVEAFACGTPVIASNAASIPEVAGDAATFFDPKDADALAHAIGSLTEERRTELRKRGFKRLEQFTRARVQEQLSHLYSEIDA
jgi:glycosyltransferase involved in cell wall biosynthesis